tara:strand:+ start:201 stop:512 length:312 start_codon:yes stop_codon:yes gene_type:complete
MSEFELVKGKKNPVVEAVNDILFDFLVFGVLAAGLFTLICAVLGQAEPWLGGISLAAWSFGIATTVHCLQTDGGAVMIGMICLFLVGIVVGVLYCFYWLLFLS